MNKTILFFLSGLLFSVFALAQPGNINLSNALIYSGEPYLTVNPLNSQNVVVAWMALDASTGFKVTIKSKASFDGGQTWSTAFLQPHFGANWTSADVSMQFRKNGTLYLCYIDSRQSPDSGGVYVTHSNDGGLTWSNPNRAFNVLTDDPGKAPLDRPWLMIDNSTSANDGMFYITTKPAPWIAPPNRPYLKTSSDSSLTWSAYRYVDTTNYLVGNFLTAPMGFPAVTADGALCVAYPSYVVSQSVYPKYFLAKSYNHGSSFQYYDLLVNPSAVPDTNYKKGYVLAADPTDPNLLAFVYPDNNHGDADVYIVTSSDGGVTWSSGKRVNDDPIANGKAQDMIWVSYNKQHHLLVTWRDRRNGSGSGFFQSSDTYCAVSTDNGQTFRPNIRLSNATAAFDSVLMQNGNDFLSCALMNDTIYSAWGDVRSGKLNIYFAKTSDSTGIGTGIISIDQQEGNALSIYPNPADDFISINGVSPENEPLHFTLESLDGRKVYLNSLLNTLPSTISLSHIPAGIYLLNIYNEDGFHSTLKLCVQHVSR